MSRVSIHLVGYYVLVEQVEHSKTPVSKNAVLCGRVIQKGPGFLTQNNGQGFDDIDVLLGESAKAKFIPLDVDEGDLVYYNNQGGEEVYLEGKQYIVVPYTAIRLFTRKG